MIVELQEWIVQQPLSGKLLVIVANSVSIDCGALVFRDHKGKVQAILAPGNWLVLNPGEFNSDAGS